MEADGIAVYLVLHLCQNLEEFALWFQLYCYGFFFAGTVIFQEQEFLGAVLVVLCQTCDGDVKMQLVFHYFAYAVHLSDAAVTYYKVWKVFTIAIATESYLLH